MVSSSIWCSAPNKVVEQELLLLLVWFEGHPSSPGFARRTPEAFCFLLLYLVYAYVTRVHTWVCPHGYIHLQGLRLQQLLPFCSRGNHPSSSALAHLHCPSTLVVIAPPILSVHISSEMLCPSTATCWSPACVSSLSSERRNSSILCLAPHEF